MRHTVIGADAFRLMTTERVLPNGVHTGYGLGVDLSTVNGHRVVTHGGNVIGFAAENSIAPDDGVAVVVLANSYEAPASDIAARLLRSMLQRTQPLRAPSAAGTSRAQVVPRSRASRVPSVAAATELIRAWIPRLQSGSLADAQMTADFRALMNGTNVARARRALALLGPVQSVEFESQFPRGGLTVTAAEVVFAKRAFQAMLYQTPDGKIAELFLSPELPP